MVDGGLSSSQSGQQSREAAAQTCEPGEVKVREVIFPPIMSAAVLHNHSTLVKLIGNCDEQADRKAVCTQPDC